MASSSVKENPIEKGIDGINEGIRSLQEVSKEEWTIPIGSVPSVNPRREEVDESRIASKEVGSNKVIQRLYYDDGTPTPYNEGDVLGLLRQHPEERNAGGLLSRLIVDMMAEQTPEERAAEPPGEDFDIRAACSRGGDGDDSVSSFIYQDFLRRYMRSRTPERGMLVYHGLGAGKTGASIGVIEACLDSRNVAVILPASLRDNYIRQLKKFIPSFWGNGYLGGNRFWKFVEATTEETQLRESKRLNVPIEIVKEQNGIFEVHPTAESGGIPRQEMSREERKRLDNQLVNEIFCKLDFYASNGLTTKRGKRSERLVSIGGKCKRKKTTYVHDINLDNCVIVCDEVQKIIGMRRNKSPVGVALYEKIRDAKNAKVIALSGTPIINAPYEIAILANMLHGHHTLHVFSFSFSAERTIEGQTDEAVITDVLSDPVVRYTRVQPSRHRGAGNELVIVRHPDGFRSVYNSEGKYAGVVYEPEWEGGIGSTLEWRNKLAQRLRKKGIILMKKPSDVRTESEEWLPEDEEVFLNMYTTDSARHAEGDEIIKRKEELSRRLLGMVSFYRVADKHLLPRENPIQIVPIEMSEVQFGVYAESRKSEMRQEDNARKYASKSGSGDKDDVFGARSITRPICNVVLPESIVRPSKYEIAKKLGVSSTQSAKVTEEYARESRIAVESLREHPAMNEKDIDTLRLNIQKYSPKTVAILDKINETPGIALIYSNYLHIGGLETMSVFMDKLGYAPIRIIYDVKSGYIREQLREKQRVSKGGSNDESNMRIEGILQTEDNPDEREKYVKSPKYMIYSGETDEITRSVIVSIFRGEVNLLPRKLREDVYTILGGKDKVRGDGTDNLHGEISKVLMITGAGAEGLDLRGIRQVHIMEPYWNRAREEQVYGRAARICSHALLPSDERDVDRFIYVSVFGSDQLVENDSDELVARDNKKSTDEYIYDLATRKQRVIDTFMRLMQSVAVDCALHAKKNDMLPTECYVAPHGDLRELATPSFVDDKDDLRVIKPKSLKGLIDIEATLVYRDHEGNEYPRGSAAVVYDPSTKTAYEMDSILTGYVIPIGKMEPSSDGMDRIVLYHDIYADGEVPVGKSSHSSSKSHTILDREEVSASAAAASAAGAVSREPVIQPGKYIFRESEYTLKVNKEEYDAGMKEMMDAALWDLFPRCVDINRQAVFLIGHSGSGKSTVGKRIIESELSKDYDSFVRIDPDELLARNPFYMEHIHSAPRTSDGKIIINPNVIQNKTIRRMIRDGVDQMLQLCIENGYSFIYETLWTDYEYYRDNVLYKVLTDYNYQPPEGETYLFVLHNPDMEETIASVNERASNTGRFIRDDIIKSSWITSNERIMRDESVSVYMEDIVNNHKMYPLVKYNLYLTNKNQEYTVKESRDFRE